MSGEAPAGAIAIAVCAKPPVGFDVNSVPAVAAMASDPISPGQSACGYYWADNSWTPMHYFIYPMPGASTGDQPVLGGEVVGLEIGGAVLLAMAVAFGFRSLRRMLESSGES
jgi:hypothetical protein